MHIDARKLDNHSVIEGDICIVGAGTAGISIALDWMNTPYKVILLEGGGFEYDGDIQDLNAGIQNDLLIVDDQNSRPVIHEFHQPFHSPTADRL